MASKIQLVRVFRVPRESRTQPFLRMNQPAGIKSYSTMFRIKKP